MSKIMPISSDLGYFLAENAKFIVDVNKNNDGMSIDFQSEQRADEVIKILDRYYISRGFTVSDNPLSEGLKFRIYDHHSGSQSQLILTQFGDKYSAFVSDNENDRQGRLRALSALESDLKKQTTVNN